jgi:hypothetical protein
MELRAGATEFSLKIGMSESGLNLYILEDKGKGISITNNAETVIKEIRANYGAIPDNSVIVYRDTLGTWDGLKVNGGEFAEHKPLGAITESEALSMSIAKKHEKYIIVGVTGAI